LRRASRSNDKESSFNRRRSQDGEYQYLYERDEHIREIENKYNMNRNPNNNSKRVTLQPYYK
jgi:hypothetical protein